MTFSSTPKKGNTKNPVSVAVPRISRSDSGRSSCKKLRSYLVMRNCTVRSIGQCCTGTVTAAGTNPPPNPSFTPYFSLCSSPEGNGHISCFPEQLAD